MKKLCVMLVVLLSTGMLKAQENGESEITTSVLTLQNLITHASDTFPKEDSQQIYILIETNENGLSQDAIFYLEQGVRLLLKRLKTDDKIALGSYGFNNRTILPFTEVANSEQIVSALAKVLHGSKREFTGQDGIDLAYRFSLNEFNETSENKVIMLRNDQVNRKTIASSAVKASKMDKKKKGAQGEIPNNTKLGGAIALTALSILPEILEVIKN